MTLTPEGEVKLLIIAALGARGIDNWPVTVSPMKVARGRAKNPMRGHPDRAGLLPGGRYLAIEVKAPDWKGELDQYQAAWRERLTVAGALYVLARSVADVVAALETA